MPRSAIYLVAHSLVQMFDDRNTRQNAASRRPSANPTPTPLNPLCHLILIASAAPDVSSPAQYNANPALDGTTITQLPALLRARNIHFNIILTGLAAGNVSLIELQKHSMPDGLQPGNFWKQVPGFHTIKLSGYPPPRKHIYNVQV